MQEKGAILSMIFEQQSMLTTLLIALAVLFVTGVLFIVLMYGGGI